MITHLETQKQYSDTCKALLSKGSIDFVVCFFEVDLYWHSGALFGTLKLFGLLWCSGNKQTIRTTRTVENYILFLKQTIACWIRVQGLLVVMHSITMSLLYA